MKKQATKGVLAIFVFTFCVFVTWEVRVLVFHNMAAVEGSKVYRSSQMSGDEFKSVANKLKLKTIINLRGANIGSKWYDEEIAASNSAAVKHFDIRLSAGRLPPPDQIKLLFDIFDKGPYPILIHCASGADRTGLVSALYLIDVKKEDIDRASQQLTWKFGHIPIGKTHAMDLFLELYKKRGRGLSLRDWVVQDYTAIYEKLKNEPNQTLETKTLLVTHLAELRFTPSMAAAHL